MLYAFMLFWPANVLPIYLLVALLQIYIPLNILTRSMFMDSDQYAKHKLASVVIAAAVICNSFVLVDQWAKYGAYYLIFLGSALIDVLSHSLKESLVRNIPINQQRFNLSISVAQLIACLVLSPVVLGLTYKLQVYPEGSVFNKL